MSAQAARKGRRGLKGPAIGATILAALGVIVLLLAMFAGRTSPKGWIPKNYTRVSAGTYQSTSPPLEVAGLVVNRFKTKDRVYTPGGIFLRYHDTVVGILPNGRGSRITIDDPDRGYARYHSSVGSSWGGPGGRVSSFRGGGPGEGK